uniref:Uncharacterized protein n=1 Tax=Anguilla anguilla TaxID=7936 RepID=A0A0E9UE08_ANGAN
MKQPPGQYRQAPERGPRALQTGT